MSGHPTWFKCQEATLSKTHVLFVLYWQVQCFRQVAGVWLRDQKRDKTTVGQLLMEPVGPVCLCAQTHACTRADTHTHTALCCITDVARGWWGGCDGQWLALGLQRWWAVAASSTCLSPSCHCLLWQLRVGAKNLCSPKKRKQQHCPGKSHWPPGYLVQINNIYYNCYSWSPCGCPELHSAATPHPRVKPGNNYSKLSHTYISLFSIAKMSPWIWLWINHFGWSTQKKLKKQRGRQGAYT